MTFTQHVGAEFRVLASLVQEPIFCSCLPEDNSTYMAEDRGVFHLQKPSYSDPQKSPLHNLDCTDDAIALL